MSGGKDKYNDAALLKILKSKHVNTIAVFSKADYFTVYEADAKFVATNIFRSDVCLKSFTPAVTNSSVMKFISMNRGQYEKVVRETILLHRCSVELYATQDDSWKIVKRGSPGNTVEFEDEVGVCDQAPILAIHIDESKDNNHVTLCAWDSGNVRLIISDFYDTPSFSQVEQCVFALCPNEYIIINQDVTSSRVKKLTSMLAKMEVHSKPGESLKTKSNWNVLSSIIHEECQEELEKLNDVVKECLQTLHANASEGYSDFEKYRLINYGAHGHMQLDSCAVEALELFQLNYNYLEKSTNLTLYNVLNNCKTLPGEKLLRDWISRPLCQIEHINERLDIVEALVESSNIRMRLKDSILARFPDCSQIARKLMKKPNLKDLNRFYQATTLMEGIEMLLCELCEAGDGRFKKSIDRLLKKDLENTLKQVEKFQVLCDELFDFEYEKETKEIRVRIDYIDGIQDVKENMEKVEKLAKKQLKKYSEKFGSDAIKLDKNAEYGFYFRVTLKEEKNIRKQKVEILEATKGNGLKFTVPELADINEKFIEFHQKYAKAEEQVTSIFFEKSKDFIPIIPFIAQLTATLDVFVSLATFASNSSTIYTRPSLLEMGSKKMKLIQCRHPVIEKTSDRPFIPNDVIFDENRLMVLTGANMGGKSTYLRSAALTILLAQIGSFVPCEEATITVVDGIFTRVGASDKQSRGISTFMAEMLDCAAILQRASEKSFVVVDELGRGTSTFDGFGIASAIAQDILDRVKSLCIFATHFHEMGEMAKRDGVTAQQMSVQVDGNSINMLYKVIPGVAQCSFGLQVAKMVGIDEDVIERATKKLHELESRISMNDTLKKELLDAEDIRKAVLKIANRS